MSLSPSEAKRWIQRVLSQASFGDVRVRITEDLRGHLRFAQGQPTTEGDVERLTIQVTAARDGRHATVTGNRTDDAGLAALVRQAEELAELAPPDPELMPPMGKTSYPKVRGSDPAAAKMNADARVAEVGAAISGARDKGVEVAGFLEHSLRTRALGDRAGLFAHHAATEVSMTTTCRTSDGTGSARAGYLSHAAAGLRGAALAEDAALRALKSQNPERIEPGRYTVILTPDAVADLLSFLGHGMDLRAADEGRSWFARPGGGNRIGEQLFDSSITMFSDPTDPKHPAAPFDREGVPQAKTTWVEKGKLLALTAGRYWADRQGVPVRPSPSSVHLAGTNDDLDALIDGVDRGILVSRFWYNRMLARRTLTATGLTRDGTFLVEGGRITKAIGNLRYNDSPITLLTNVEALGRPERAVFADGFTVWVVPPMVVGGFNFESNSDAI